MEISKKEKWVITISAVLTVLYILLIIYATRTYGSTPTSEMPWWIQFILSRRGTY